MIEITQETVDFIKTYRHEDVAKLLFRKDRFLNVNIPFAIQQIAGYKKALEKLPNLAKNEHFLYPATISLEQCSSEQTACYKADLLNEKIVADITGGFGIDSFFISDKAREVFYVEQDPGLCQIAKHNFSLYEKRNLYISCSDGLTFLRQSNIHYDYIYLDPSRRNSDRKKVVLLHDCIPNILEHKEFLFSKTDAILLKASPMLDISSALRELGNVREVHILAINNECKELLFVCCAQAINETKFLCVNISGNKKQSKFCLFANEEADLSINHTNQLKKYLYEPNVSILKAGAFKSVAKQFGIEKLHPHSHLYTSDRFIENFPGRIFCIRTHFSLSEKNIREFIPNKKVNITVRNFPLTSEQIRKKYNLLDGGEMFIFATTLQNGEKTIILCERMIKENME